MVRILQRHGKTIPFTHIALTLVTVGYFLSPTILRVAAACLWGNCFSFYAVPLLDSTAYKRMQRKNDFSPLLFHVGNFALHLLPCVMTYLWPPILWSVSHGLVAAVIHVLWGLYETNGSLYLNKIYVDLPNRAWTILWFITVVCDVSAPAIVCSLQSARSDSSIFSEHFNLA